MTLAVTLLTAVLLDMFLGEPKFNHPLRAFGRLANWAEQLLRGSAADLEPGWLVKGKGALGVTICMVPLVVLSALLTKIPVLSIFFNAAILYLCIGANSLIEHAQEVLSFLTAGDLARARISVSRIVSRDTSDLNADGITQAAIESVLENGSDAVFAALFWFVLLGAPGVVMYRLSNTLDAMWGYKSSRYLHFGWAAARLDDVLNWVPARLTAMTYTLLGDRHTAWQCWRRQAPLWYSPNAGPVMASGAGSLGIILGGQAIYDGRAKERPTLGEGRTPVPDDIKRAIMLIRKGLFLWVALVTVWGMCNA